MLYLEAVNIKLITEHKSPTTGTPLLRPIESSFNKHVTVLGKDSI